MAERSAAYKIANVLIKRMARSRGDDYLELLESVLGIVRHGAGEQGHASDVGEDSGRPYGASGRFRESEASALLRRADQKRLFELIVPLIAAGADKKVINILPGKFTELAVKCICMRINEGLLRGGVDENEINKSLAMTLMTAARKDYEEVVRLLLDHGVDANAWSLYWETPVLVAARAGHEEVVNLLLDHSADVRARNDHMQTALMLASRSGHAEVVKSLLDHGADVNARDDEDDTALIMAARRQNLGAAELLLDYGVDVNAVNKKGDTALVISVRKRDDEVIRLLLACGADPRGVAPKDTSGIFGDPRRRGLVNLFSEAKDFCEVASRDDFNEVLGRLKKGVDWVVVSGACILAFQEGRNRMGRFLREYFAGVYRKVLEGGHHEEAEKMWEALGKVCEFEPKVKVGKVVIKPKNLRVGERNVVFSGLKVEPSSRRIMRRGRMGRGNK